MGNTCFVNSLLQALASLSSFEENLREVMAAMRGRPDRHEELLIELASVMRRTSPSTQRSTATTKASAWNTCWD
jgi:hypothetical protein